MRPMTRPEPDPAAVGELVGRFAHHHRRLTESVDALERTDVRELRALFRRKRTSVLMLNFASPRLRGKVVGWLIAQTVRETAYPAGYLAAVATVPAELVRSALPGLVDRVVTREIEPEYDVLLELLWTYEDLPQFQRMIGYLRAYATAHEKAWLAEFLTRHDPAELESRARGWWAGRESQLSYLEDPSDVSEPSHECMRAWHAFAAASVETREAAKALGEHELTLVVETAKRLHDSAAFVRLILSYPLSLRFREVLRQLGDDVASALVPDFLRLLEFNAALAADGTVLDALCARGLLAT